MSGLGSHFARIIAFLGYDTSSAVYPSGTVAFNAPDRTLRIHDGCTKGGYYKIQLVPRCGDKETQGTIKLKDLPKGAIRILEFPFPAGEATQATVEALTFKFKGDYSMISGIDSVLDDTTVERSVFAKGEPEVVLIEGKAPALTNFEDTLNADLAKFGMEFKAMADTLDGNARLAVRGPANVAYDFSVATKDGLVFKAKAVEDTNAKTK